ncbi:MAG: hypothetical protein IT338_11895 [Thermomicrobiales bacterium]|nr:hypothetical protein [Thermomicrobiales bacterium]
MSVPDRQPDAAADLVYANGVTVVAEPGGLRLIFTRTPTAGEPSNVPEAAESDVIARLVLPPLAARRLLRLLPERLDHQQALAEAYDRETEGLAGAAETDPFLAALAAAEEDDEPYTEEQRAAAQAGREAFARGEFASLDDVWHELVGEEATPVSES